MLRAFRGEFDDLGLPVLVKLRYATDGDPDGCEHLWFELHELRSDSIDGRAARRGVACLRRERLPMIGEILHEDVPLWTPWLYRGADNAVFTFELIVSVTGLDVQASVFTKNTEQTGTPSSAMTNGTWSSSGVGFHSHEVNDLEEMYRLKLETTGTPLSGEPLVLFRWLEVTWFDHAHKA